MMLRHNLRTDAQICGKSATQASLFVRHGRGVNRVYCFFVVVFMSDRGRPQIGSTMSYIVVVTVVVTFSAISFGYTWRCIN